MAYRIQTKAIEFVVNKYEPSKGRKARDVSKTKGLGFDVESDGRIIEVKGTEADKPNKGGLHITLLPNQYKILKRNLNYWIYRVYNVGSKGREKVVPIPRNEILLHLTPYIVHKLVLEKEEWKQLEKERT